MIKKLLILVFFSNFAIIFEKKTLINFNSFIKIITFSISQKTIIFFIKMINI